MLYKRILIITILVSLYTNYLSAETKTIAPDDLNGNWHLRIMDNMEVRNARAILDFDMNKMILSGFDGCNRISGTLKVTNDTYMTSQLVSTRMACREPIHSYTSKRLHKTIKEGFTVSEASRNGVDGITIKSSTHELFFKKMGDDKKWF
jgi:heat shock protein HslJ